MNFKLSETKPLIGDWLVMIASIGIVIMLFQTLWTSTPASQLKIKQANNTLGTYDLDQSRHINIHGALGDSIIHIENGKVRFKQSPCNNQYCVHQGWLNRAGQVAICLPNQISLQLTGAQKVYDSLNY